MKMFLQRFPAIPFVAPFGAFMVLLALRSHWPIDSRWEYPARAVIVTVIALCVLRRASLKPTVYPLQSIVFGVLIFALWVLPDRIWPSYHSNWLFQNRWTGSPQSSLNPALHSDIVFLTFRIFGTAVLVPVIEELFWRG